MKTFKTAQKVWVDEKTPAVVGWDKGRGPVAVWMLETPDDSLMSAKHREVSRTRITLRV